MMSASAKMRNASLAAITNLPWLHKNMGKRKSRESSEGAMHFSVTDGRDHIGVVDRVGKV
jgi:hypothetical protein